MTYTAPKSQYHNFLVEQLVLIGVSHRRGGAAALEAWRAHFETMLTQDIRAKEIPFDANPPAEVLPAEVLPAEVMVNAPRFLNSEALLASTAVLSQMVTSHTPRLCDPQFNTRQMYEPHAAQSHAAQSHAAQSHAAQSWHQLGFVEC